jgi:hypothetical protein
MGALKQRAILYMDEIAKVPEEEKMSKRKDEYYKEALDRIIQKHTATPDDEELWDEEVWAYKRGYNKCECMKECKDCKCKGDKKCH